ncbi:MAG: hypothetical protein A2499_16805 [Stygiobacter sp. RIFOXYC12_FULL_38_8]|nr:MAG: hypothetical protein A2499_16805 [Stygiobacter sp. RIFOXYC12_FULL_38_8]
MKKVLVLLIITSVCFAQDIDSVALKTFSTSAFELKGGVEVYRSYPIGGIGYKIYLSKYLDLVPELDVIGIPIINAFFQYKVPLSKKMLACATAGAGILPLGYTSFTASIFGIGSRIQISTKINLVVELKSYFFAGKILDVGPKEFREKRIKESPPLALTVGIVL